MTRNVVEILKTTHQNRLLPWLRRVEEWVLRRKQEENKVSFPVDFLPRAVPEAVLPAICELRLVK